MKEESCPSPLRLPPILRQPMSITGLYLPRHNRIHQRNQPNGPNHPQNETKMLSSYEHVPAVIKGHRHFSFGGSVLPESIIIEQYYDITNTKRSNIRINDQLVPKPTDIDMSKKMIKVDVPQENPYSSHIARYPAVFPSSSVQRPIPSAPVIVWRHHHRTKVYV
ncbi:hypothetical protein DNTS_010842 [Danionella cerebrum]|uniref:Uncharacterized protein n=1 Tax=Danionella cerebrum TaxID=2873325 RepID=A0A553QTH8_9TELE|nr:hypothetical protein DNTS_010842 [Danionella translucida]